MGGALQLAFDRRLIRLGTGAGRGMHVEGEDIGVSTARLALQSQHVDDALAQVQRVLDGWGARSAFVPLWLRTAASSLGSADEAELVMEFDPDARLLSFDAFVGSRRVYGADDWLG